MQVRPWGSRPPWPDNQVMIFQTTKLLQMIEYEIVNAIFDKYIGGYNKKMKTIKKLGYYECGYTRIVVMLDYNDTGGWFSLLPRGTAKEEPPMITIGIDTKHFDDIYGWIHHELLEMNATIMGLRYNPNVNISNGNDSYLFVFDHSQLSDLARRTAEGMSTVEPDLKKAWEEHMKSKNKKKKGR